MWKSLEEPKFYVKNDLQENSNFYFLLNII